MKKKSLCIIPARGGSKRIPGKNVKLFRGKPLMTYSIGAAISCGRFENIMVSTEDKKIAEVAEAYGAEVPFLRDPKTANDTAGLAEVLVEVLQCYEKQGVDYTYAACVLATAPLIRPQALAEAFDRLEADPTADGITSVERFSYPPQRGLVEKDGMFVMHSPEHYFARSQDLPVWFHDCGQFFIFRSKSLLRDKKLYVNRLLGYEIPGTESQDIDNEEDFSLAELKYEWMKKRGRL